jgi:ferrous iron transport protein B
LFAWADPAIGFIEGIFGSVGGAVRSGFEAAAAGMPALAGPLALVGDLVVDGVIGGVGAVLVFIPQIALLFAFIAILEDCGYLARAAHLMDRVLRAAGLPGQAFVPLLSGYACAVPAIMATRTMPRFRDRLLTIMVVPLTSCSARLPVYTLLIGSLFPPTIVGLAFPFRPVMLFGMYAFSTAVTVLAAVVIGRFIVPGETTPAVLELPPYRVPDPSTVLRAVAGQCRDFVREAGRVILVATVVLWALLSFPRYTPEDLLAPEVLAEAQATGEDLEALSAPIALERSWAGQIGKAMEPAIAPLGYDWKIGVGLVGAFAAREVFVSTMGVVYGIGDVDEESTALRQRIRTEKRPDGQPVYTPLVGLSIMVFFALAMQCLSTLAVLRKETNGWRWPVFVFVYMTALAWISALFVYQGGRILGFA